MPAPIRLSRFAFVAAGAVALAACAAASPEPVVAQPSRFIPAVAPQPTYVDLIEMVRNSSIIARVAIDEQITVPADRAPGVAFGHSRIYVESLTQALIGGNVPVGGQMTFVADVPVNPDGKPPRLDKLDDPSFIVFARPAGSRPGEVQLTGPMAMQPATFELEERVREVLRQLAEGVLPPRITGVREAISIAGNLAGESETQIFLETDNGAPVSLNVLRRPGQSPRWGVSWTEIVDQAARAPQPETLQWYGLACFLPSELPDDAFLQDDREAQRRARADYAVILDDLGPCGRNTG